MALIQSCSCDPALASGRDPEGDGTMNEWEVQASPGSGQCFIARICSEFTRVTR